MRKTMKLKPYHIMPFFNSLSH